MRLFKILATFLFANACLFTPSMLVLIWKGWDVSLEDGDLLIVAVCFGVIASSLALRTADYVIFRGE